MKKGQNIYVKGDYADIFDYDGNNDGIYSATKIASILGQGMLLGTYNNLVYISSETGKEYYEISPSEDVKKILLSQGIAIPKGGYDMPEGVWLLDGTFTDVGPAKSGIPWWGWIAGAALAIILRMKN
jgi:hypothetical protein